MCDYGVIVQQEFRLLAPPASIAETSRQIDPWVTTSGLIRPQSVTSESYGEANKGAYWALLRQTLAGNNARLF